jgi:hypothetical protein
VAVDTANVYWTNGGATVMKCAIAGCAAPAVLASGQANVWEVAGNGTEAYWTDYSSGAVMSCAVAGCTNPATVSPGQGLQATGLAIDATSIYWASYGGGTVMRIAR